MNIQIYVAIIIFSLIAIVHHDIQLNQSLYEILQIFIISQTDKAPLQELLTIKVPENKKKNENEPLIFFNDMFLC
mgnify:FL=1